MAQQVYHIAGLLDHLVNAVDIARCNAAGDQRWLNALNSGYNWLLEQDAVTFDAERHELTFTSENGNQYKANGVCGCRAYAKGNACRHRAAARILRRALELQQRQAEQQRVSTIERIARAQAAAMVLFS